MIRLAGRLLDRARAVDPRLVASAYLLLGVGFWITYFRRLPNLPLFSNDTPSYLYFDPSRSIGYPALLWAIRAFSSDARLIQWAQLSLTVISYGVLCWAVGKLLANRAVGAAVFAVMLTYAGPLDSAATLISDAPATALVALTAGFMLFYLNRPSWHPLVGATVAAGIAMTMRPVNIVILPALVMLVLLSKRPTHRIKWAFAGIVLLGFIASWASSPLSQAALYGQISSSSPVARGLFGKSLFLTGPLTPAAAACEGSFVAAQTDPVRTYIRQSDGRVRQFLEQKYSDYLRFAVIIPDMTLRRGASSANDLDPILLCFAKSRIEGDPSDFIRVVVDNYLQLLTNERFADVAFRQELSQFLNSHPLVSPTPHPLDPASLAQFVRARRDLGIGGGATGPAAGPPPFSLPQIEAKGPFPRLMVAAFQIITWVVSPIVLLARILAGRRFFDSPSWTGVGCLGIIFHGHLAISSVVEVGLARYTYPLWSIACVCVTLIAFNTLHWAIGGTFTKRSKSKTP